jgi:hypothetical protein
LTYLLAFARFCWDFVVGDDWLVAAGIVVALGVTALLTRFGVAAWWLMPVAAVALLGVSLRRAVHSSAD